MIKEMPFQIKKRIFLGGGIVLAIAVGAILLIIGQRVFVLKEPAKVSYQGVYTIKTRQENIWLLTGNKEACAVMEETTVTIPFNITLSKIGMDIKPNSPEIKPSKTSKDFSGGAETKAIWGVSIKDIEPPSEAPLTCVRIAPVAFEEEVPLAYLKAVIFDEDAQNVRFDLTQVPNPRQPSGLRNWRGVNAMRAAVLEFEQTREWPYGYFVSIPVAGGEFTKSGRIHEAGDIEFEVVLRINTSR